MLAFKKGLAISSTFFKTKMPIFPFIKFYKLVGLGLSNFRNNRFINMPKYKFASDSKVNS